MDGCGEGYAGGLMLVTKGDCRCSGLNEGGDILKYFLLSVAMFSAVLLTPSSRWLKVGVDE